MDLAMEKQVAAVRALKALRMFATLQDLADAAIAFNDISGACMQSRCQAGRCHGLLCLHMKTSTPQSKQLPDTKQQPVCQSNRSDSDTRHLQSAANLISANAVTVDAAQPTCSHCHLWFCRVACRWQVACHQPSCLPGHGRAGVRICVIPQKLDHNLTCVTEDSCCTSYDNLMTQCQHHLLPWSVYASFCLQFWFI